MRVAEFAALPKADGQSSFELHDGQMVPGPRPKLWHARLRSHIRKLLQPVVPQGGLIDIEMVFCPRGEFDLLAADLGYLAPERVESADPDGYIEGAPDLVLDIITALRPAETWLPKQRLCLATGAQEYWLVSRTQPSIQIARRSGSQSFYRSAQEYWLVSLGGGELAVDAIFS